MATTAARAHPAATSPRYQAVRWLRAASLEQIASAAAKPGGQRQYNAIGEDRSRGRCAAGFQPSL